MGRPALHFLLVPDGSAARRIRRTLAQSRARSGVIVGTWPELLARAQDAYCVSPPRGIQTAFEGALESAEDAFWSKSYSTAPDETERAIRNALIDLLSSTDPLQADPPTRLDDVPSRTRQIVRELFELAASLGSNLPGDLATIWILLEEDSDSIPQPVRVHRVAGSPKTTRWQDALIDRLNRDADRLAGIPDGNFEKTLEDHLRTSPSADPRSVLGALQERLYEPSESAIGLDNSVQWIGVRDFYQEAEVTAGIVQGLLEKHPQTRTAEIGLLVPEDFQYSVALEDAFGLAGIPLSGLPGERWRRDLGAEAVYHFLYCRQKPAPRMALAVCLSSVLMPWTVEAGAVMAQAVMDGDYDPRPPRYASDAALAMLALLNGGDTEPATLATALGKYSSLLNGGEAFAMHREQALETAERVIERLKDAKSIDWSALRHEALPRMLRSGESPDYNLEGVTVWRELHEPWRPVRHLFVLGFAQGRYPRGVRSAPIFAADDIRAIRGKLGLQIDAPSDDQHRQRQLFLRQLRAASDSVTFLIPRRRPDGAAVAPSESLVFMRRLVSAPASGRDLIAELDSSEDIQRIRHLALAEPRRSKPPRELRREPLRFKRNLLEFRTDKDGNVKPESPTGLEMPLVSPLGWLLTRLNAVPRQWEPESGSGIVVGRLAHKVFEGLFRPGVELPAADEIPERTRDLLDGAIQQQAPFFRSAQWQFERMHLAEQAARSAGAWRQALEQLGAEVLGSEQWLQGKWAGIAIHGQADLILGLGDGKLLIVDYKWSSSTGRRKRMERGYDSQASLYRAMLETGGPKPPRNGEEPDTCTEELAAKIKAAKWIGIVYYTMRDHTCLADSERPEFATIPRWVAMETDVAVNASEIIQSRLKELREGVVRLNFVNDREYFNKHGSVPGYALETSPLIELFTLPEPDLNFDPWRYKIPLAPEEEEPT